MSSDAQTRNYVIMPWSKEAGKGGTLSPHIHTFSCFWKNLEKTSTKKRSSVVINNIPYVLPLTSFKK